MKQGMIMPFGKHKDEYLELLSSSYLKWLAENCEWDIEVQEAADEEWQWREKYNEHRE
jgi:hypothetical protein